VSALGRERIFIQLMTSDRKLKASREGTGLDSGGEREKRESERASEQARVIERESAGEYQDGRFGGCPGHDTSRDVTYRDASLIRNSPPP